MTRSQGPTDQTPPQWRQTTRAAQQPQSANDQQAHWQPQQQQQPSGYEADPYAQQHAGQAAQYHQPQDPAAAYPQGGEHAYPSAYDHYAQQANYSAAQQQNQYPDPGYAQPAYDVAASQPSYPDPFAAQPGYPEPQYTQPAQDYSQPQQDYPTEDYWGNAPGGLGNPAAQHQQRQVPDNQAYDLGNYMPAGADSRPAFGEPGYRPRQNWDVGNNAFGDPGQPVDRGFDQGGYQGGAAPRFEGAVAHHTDSYGHEHDDDFEYDDEDEEPGGGRKVIIAAALVAAIVVGGGFAYGYNALFGGSQGAGGGTPIVKAETAPAKEQPANPGGRQFEHKDSKVLGKLSGDGQNSTAYSTSEGQANGRVRSVSTLVVGRDGRLIVPDNQQSNNANNDSQPAPNASPAGTITSTSSVPGLTIVGVNPPAAPPQQAQPSAPPSPPPQALGAREVQPSNEVAPQPAPQAPAAAPAQQQQVAAAVTQPQAQPQPQPQPAPVRRGRRSKLPPLPVRSSARTGGQAVAAAPAQTAAPAQGVAQARVTPVVPQQNQVANQQPAAAPATTASVSGAAAANGYVAVLSTKRSRIDALTSFADLQQKYGNILGNKVPAVRRADLSARGLGIMYRAVVGPPGSRQGAAQVCNQLKSAGYSGCWVAPY